MGSYRPQGYKIFMLYSNEHEASTTHKITVLKRLLLVSNSDVVFIMLINVKIQTTVLTFIRMINFMLICVEHDKTIVTSGPYFVSLIDCLSRSNYYELLQN